MRTTSPSSNSTLQPRVCSSWANGLTNPDTPKLTEGEHLKFVRTDELADRGENESLIDWVNQQHSE
ncbi:hypothetical protein [Anabaena sp. UHCC 0451]|uniref:hypothetical protein n=1 Tax=Anabaena sp. UHCC 0451 TaxID=2055235 RepID=UPI002B207ECE|nr:hypothetical protein [Anabaena sp. UHCC 0451]MEA5577667.1 hypothetical protein [Anabaena sp. UHCC 0451]